MCVSTKIRVFQKLGQFFKKSVLVVSTESQCYHTMLILNGDDSWTCQSPRHYVCWFIRWDLKFSERNCQPICQKNLSGFWRAITIVQLMSRTEAKCQTYLSQAMLEYEESNRWLIAKPCTLHQKRTQIRFWIPGKILKIWCLGIRKIDKRK